MTTKIVLVDDHILLRNGLAEMLANKGFEILFQASNGKEFIDCLLPNQLPHVVLMDVNMPVLGGCETTEWLNKKYKQIKVLALSMYDDEANIIKMLRAGARGYVLKYADSEELINAINTVAHTGFYYSDLVNSKLVNSVYFKQEDAKFSLTLTEKETQFLQLCCSELNYKEIAVIMQLSHKTVENYREQLCSKLDIHTRVGLVMYAIKNGIFIL